MIIAKWRCSLCETLHCKRAVARALAELGGVGTVEVDLTTGQVQVQYDDSKVSEATMANAIRDAGYDVGGK